MNRLKCLRPGSAGNLKTSYPDPPSTPTSPRTIANSSSPAMVKVAVAVILMTAVLFTVCTVATIESRARLFHVRVSSSSSSTSRSVEVVNPARIIQRTEQLYTIRTETIQDTTFQKVAKDSKPTDAHQIGPSSDVPAGVGPSLGHPQEDQQHEGLKVVEGGGAASGFGSGAEQFRVGGTLQPAELPRPEPVHQQKKAKRKKQHKQRHEQHQAQHHEQQHEQLHEQQQATISPDHKPIILTEPAVPEPSEEQLELAKQAPADFDWHMYLYYYPDLMKAGITSEVLAKFHYVTSGKAERRLFKRVNVTLRYTACGGLMNQHYSHIAALSLAVHLNVSVVLPPALSRNSFASYFSMDPAKNKVFWKADPASIMWDVEYIRNYWSAARGISISEAPHQMALPDLSRPGSAYPTYLPDNYTWAQVGRLDGIYLKARSLAYLLKQAKQIILNTASVQPTPETPILLDCPCTLFMLRTFTAPLVVKEVARSLKFHPKMEALSAKIISSLNLNTFNGLHLRMEDDAKDWARILGGRDKLLSLYLAACRRAGFDSSTPVYLASGLFTYGSTDHNKRNIIAQLARYSSKLLYKEQVLTSDDVRDLTKEQQALLDFLVLARAQYFVGISVSTFSYYLQEYRALADLPKSTTLLVSGKKIGTDPLFDKCARVVL